MPFNQEQKKAIEHRNGPCLVLAGPGSGKTFVITNRIRYLIEKCKICPESILVITFTKAATAQMQARFMKLMNDCYSPVLFGTFHSIFYSILKQSNHYINHKLITQQQKIMMIQEILEQYCPGIETDESGYEYYLNEISKKKNSIRVESFVINSVDLTQEETIFQTIFQAYCNEQKKQCLLDFDDMALEVFHLLSEHKNIREEWQERFQYILLDEFQDINEIQYEVIRLLTGKEQNIFAVGDDDQAIYGFRGADPSILFRFQKDFLNVLTLTLQVNYRSEEEIVQISQKLISHNTQRFTKNMHSSNVEKSHDVIKCLSYTSEQEMQLDTIHLIEKRRKKVSLNEIAIIYRTNHMASEMMEKLHENGIPYYTSEKISHLYEHFIVKDIMAYLSLAFEQYSREQLFAIMNKPTRYLSRRCIKQDIFTFEEMIFYYKDKVYIQERIRKMKYLIEKVKGLPLTAGIHLIRKWGGYEAYLSEYAREKHLKFDELYDILEQFTEKASSFSAFRQLKSHMEDFLSHKEPSTSEIPQQEGVRIMTYHGAKGLEFDTVILPQVNEGSVPHKKASSIEEERRMFYVAMTRAKGKLWILYLKKTAESKNYPSRFLKEMME